MPNTTRIILPTASVKPVTINLGMPSTSWFDIRSLDAPKDDNFENVIISKVNKNI